MQHFKSTWTVLHQLHVHHDLQKFFLTGFALWGAQDCFLFTPGAYHTQCVIPALLCLGSPSGYMHACIQLKYPCTCHCLVCSNTHDIGYMYVSSSRAFSPHWPSPVTTPEEGQWWPKPWEELNYNQLIISSINYGNLYVMMEVSW